MSDELELREKVVCLRCGLPKESGVGLSEEEHDDVYVCLDTAKAEIARLTRERDDARSEAVAHASEFAAMIVGQECHLAEQRGIDRAATLAEQRGHVTIADAIRALTPEGDDD